MERSMTRKLDALQKMQVQRHLLMLTVRQRNEKLHRVGQKSLG
jgi:hypothetical protein